MDFLGLLASRFFVFTTIVLVSLEAQGQVVNPTLSTSEAIEKIMQIFYLKPSMRSPYDKMEIVGSELKLEVWRDLPTDPDPKVIECTGYQWLVSGRGQKMGTGAAEVFHQFQNLQTITLELFTVEMQSASVDKRGKFEKKAIKKPYLTMVADRRVFERVTRDPKALKRAFHKSTEECLNMGRQVIAKKEIRL